jgi:hypothetical protein
MKKALSGLLLLSLILGCTSSYNVWGGIGKLSGMLEKHAGESGWGPDAGLVEEGLAELEEYEQELQGVDEAKPVLELVLAAERVYEAKIAIKQYEYYEADENLCSIKDALITSLRITATRLEEAAQMYENAAEDYAEEYGKYNNTVKNTAQDYAGIAENLRTQTIPLYEELVEDCS